MRKRIRKAIVNEREGRVVDKASFQFIIIKKLSFLVC
jgi:hypothetical protein